MVIIALHYHCYDLFVSFFYVKIFAILYLHNYSHANKAYVVVVVGYVRVACVAGAWK